jgi:hypothetical protein
VRPRVWRGSERRWFQNLCPCRRSPLYLCIVAQRPFLFACQALEELSQEHKRENRSGTCQVSESQVLYTQVRHSCGVVPKQCAPVEANRICTLGRKAQHASGLRAEEAKQVRPRRRDDAHELVVPRYKTPQLKRLNCSFFLKQYAVNDVW